MGRSIMGGSMGGIYDVAPVTGSPRGVKQFSGFVERRRVGSVASL